MLCTFALLLLPLFAAAQTIYTTVEPACGAKNLGYCTLNVTDQNNVPFKIILDHRSNSQGPIDTLTIETPIFPSTILSTVHGSFSGFVTTGPSHDDAEGVLTFVSDDGATRANLQYVAHYVFTCSGRGCAGVVIGWHYVVLEGSTITVGNSTADGTDPMPLCRLKQPGCRKGGQG